MLHKLFTIEEFPSLFTDRMTGKERYDLPRAKEKEKGSPSLFPGKAILVSLGGRGHFALHQGGN